MIQQFEVVLRGLAGHGFPDSHIGTISTDLGAGPVAACTPGGDLGRLQGDPRSACEPPDSVPYIEVTTRDGMLGANVSDVASFIDDGPCLGEPDGFIDVCDIHAAFRCIAMLGSGGCVFQQPLESAKLALTCGDECTNAGFVREDALLAVLFLTYEDDCSAVDDSVFDPTQVSIDSKLGPFSGFRCFEFGVECDQPIDRTTNQTLTGCRSHEASPYFHNNSRYFDFFSELKPPGQVLLAAITGPFAPSDEVTIIQDALGSPTVAPSCTSSDGDPDHRAFPAIRINELVRRFESSGVVLADVNLGVGICAGDFSPVLEWLVARVVAALT